MNVFENTVILIGNVTAEPYCGVTRSNKVAISFQIATADDVDARDAWADWHRVSAYGAAAEAARGTVHVGDLVRVVGYLRNRRFTKGGVTQYSTDVIGTHIRVESPRIDDGTGDTTAEGT